MSKTAVVLGALKGSGNIGDGIAFALEENDWTVRTHTCEVQSKPPGHYDIPDLPRPGPDGELWSWYEDAEALIVTLGLANMAPFVQQGPKEIEEVIRACLTLPLLAVRRYVLERRDRGGRIVLIGSYANDHVLSASSAYCASKAGIDMAGKTLGWDLTPMGYRVHVVHPYHVPHTSMWERVQEGVMENKNMTREEADRYMIKDARMELMRPVEIGRIVRMLLETPEAEWLSGTSLRLYGGTR